MLCVKEHCSTSKDILPKEISTISSSYNSTVIQLSNNDQITRSGSMASYLSAKRITKTKALVSFQSFRNPTEKEDLNIERKCGLYDPNKNNIEEQSTSKELEISIQKKNAIVRCSSAIDIMEASSVKEKNIDVAQLSKSNLPSLPALHDDDDDDVNNKNQYSPEKVTVDSKDINPRGRSYSERVSRQCESASSRFRKISKNIMDAPYTLIRSNLSEEKVRLKKEREMLDEVQSQLRSKLPKTFQATAAIGIGINPLMLHKPDRRYTMNTIKNPQPRSRGGSIPGFLRKIQYNDTEKLEENSWRGFLDKLKISKKPTFDKMSIKIPAPLKRLKSYSDPERDKRFSTSSGDSGIGEEIPSTKPEGKERSFSTSTYASKSLRKTIQSSITINEKNEKGFEVAKTNRKISVTIRANDQHGSENIDSLSDTVVKKEKYNILLKENTEPNVSNRNESFDSCKYTVKTSPKVRIYSKTRSHEARSKLISPEMRPSRFNEIQTHHDEIDVLFNITNDQES